MLELKIHNFDQQISNVEEISVEHFGLNFVADWERIGDAPWESYDDVVEAVGSTHIRYPGGITAERGFDITDPNASEIILEDGSTRRTVGAYDFAEYCAENGLSPTFIIPTFQLLVPDPSGSGDLVFDPSNSQFVFDFVYNVLVASGGNIDAFELGNEYEAHMTSQEYGKLVNAIAPVVQAAIDKYDEDYNLQGDWGEPDICIQVWTFLANEETTLSYEDLVARANGVFSQLSEEAIECIDSVVTHWYAKDQGLSYIEAYGALETWIKQSIDLLFDSAEHFGMDVTLRVSEWNTNQKEVPFFGLAQVPVILKVFAELVQNGVDSMHFWSTLYHASSLALPDGDLTVAGALLAYLEENAPGTKPLDVESGSDQVGVIAFLGEEGGFITISNATDLERSLGFVFEELGEDYIIVSVGYVSADLSESDGSYREFNDLSPFNEPDLPGEILWEPITASFNNEFILDLDPYQTVIVEVVAIEEVLGTAATDWLVASAEVEKFQGGEGVDVVSYENADKGVVASLDPYVTGTGWAEFEIFHDVEGLSGSTFDDTLYGDSNDNLLWGGAGDDELYGQAGNDQIYTGAGEDHVFGGGGNDVISLEGSSGSAFGNEGNDSFIFQGGMYSVDGGAGYDVVDLKSATSGASIFVDSGVVEIEIQDKLEFDDVEKVVGTAYDDQYVNYLQHSDVDLGAGNDNARLGHGASGHVRLGEGDDYCYSESSQAVIHAGKGNDTIHTTFGATVQGGQGDDTFYAWGNGDVFIFNLTDGNDIIHGYNSETDGLDLSQSARDALSHGAYTLNAEEGSVVLDFAEGGSITFVGCDYVEIEQAIGDWTLG